MREATHRLRAKAEAAESARLAGCKTYTLEESEQRIEKMFRQYDENV
jgi:hypothetical protein